MNLHLLHLSDVHYESSSAFLDDDKSHVNPVLRASAFRNLNYLLEQCFLDRLFDSVIVSGDTTTQGKPEGFQSFLTQTAPLLTKVVRNPHSICVVAGNHDVKWDLDPKLPNYFDQKFQSYADFVKGLDATSCLVPTGTLPDYPHGDLVFSPQLAGPLYIDDDRRLMVLCLNSSIRCGEVNTNLRNSLSEPIEKTSGLLESLLSSHSRDSQLVVDLGTARLRLSELLKEVRRSSLFDVPHVTHSQLNRVRILLTNKRNEMKTEWLSYAKVAVFHHHVVPFNYQQPEYKAFELMADSAAILDTLGSFGFQILLTGHKHQPYVQPVSFRGTDLLVIGGMTIGGYPVPGSGQGARHLQIQRSDDHTSVKIADLPCDWPGDLYTRVKELVDNAKEYTLLHTRPIRRVGFPRQIESAVEQQLYNRSFYKTDVLFEVEIEEVDNEQLQFLTTLSYNVVNRTSEPQVWRMEYDYDQETGAVLEVRFNDIDFSPEEREFCGPRGLSIPFTLKEHDLGKAHIKVRELFPAQGAIRYTSFNAATDLKVILQKKAPSFDFDTQVLYFWEKWPVTKKGAEEVHLDQGLLPYQGVQLNWKLKEKAK